MPLRLTHEEIDAERKLYFPSGSDIRKYRAYAAGDQVKNLSAQMRTILGSQRNNNTADNVLDLVLRTTAGRLNFEGWTIENGPQFVPPEGVAEGSPETRDAAAQEVQDFLAEFYLKSRISGLQFDTHYATVRDGVTALSLRWKPGATEASPGRPSVHRENWWDGKTGVFIGFDDFDEPAWAVKDWVELIDNRPQDRRNVYYPDAIYRYIKQGGWQPYRLPDDPETDAAGKVPWVRANGTALGLPIIPFANAVADSGMYGRSDIKGLLGIQDDINQIGVDITAAAMFAGFQMYFASGMSVDGVTVGPGQFLSSPEATARMTAIPPGPMDSLIESYESKRQTIAIDTATPMHIIGGEWPSGEALLRSEMPLVDKVTRLGAVLAPSWTLLAHRATELANRFGGMTLDEAAPITVNYAAPEHLDELTEVQVQAAQVDLYAKLSNIDDVFLLVKTGLVTQSEAEQMVAERAERAKAFMETEAAF
jgi:hypothetical protein